MRIIDIYSVWCVVAVIDVKIIVIHKHRKVYYVVKYSSSISSLYTKDTPKGDRH